MPIASAEIWEPLVAVADLAGGDCPDLARRAAVHFVQAAKDIEISLGVRLLSDIKAIFDADQRYYALRSETLVEKLLAVEESPWGDIKGKPLDKSTLARRLKPYEIKPHNIREVQSVYRGYDRGDFADAWERYLAPSPKGRLTPVQATAHVLMRAAGAEVEVAVGIDAALRQLERWRMLRPHTQSRSGTNVPKCPVRVPCPTTQRE